MLRRLGPCIWVAVAAGYSEQAVSADNAAIAADGCNKIQADLRSGDLEHASTFANTLAIMTARFNPGKRVTAADGAFSGDIRETAATACGQIAAAYAAKDPQKAEIAAASLRVALAQAVAALPSTPQAKFARMDAAVSQLDGLERFYRLAPLAKAALEAGEIDKAAAYGHELVNTAPLYPTDWNFGNAVYFGNWVLGRIALRQGDLTQAGQYLLQSASTPGSPQLNTFGPNTTLAQELLQQGQTAAVIEYFNLCANFWKMDRGKLAEWTAIVKTGGMPNFGANLVY